MSDPHCAICGTSERHGAIIALSLAGNGAAYAPIHTLAVCRRCLDRRETRSWSIKDRDGKRLAQALSRRPPAGVHRFTYFRDPDGRLHLMHLRGDRVLQPAA